MKNTLKINHENRTLVMDRTFAKAASFVGSNEYNLLQDARRDYPSYQVTLRSIKKKEDKESYRGLTYQYMENYIATHANAARIMEEYKELRLQAECHSIRYPNIKKWFLAKYPEVAQFGVESEAVADDTETQEQKVIPYNAEEGGSQAEANELKEGA